LFAYSTGIRDMQMDNLSYNPDEALLVANELKLGGNKNPDQILKYASMYRSLVQRGFIGAATRFVLVFIGDREEECDWSRLIDAEVVYCQRSTKSTSREAGQPEVVGIARDAEYASTTWGELIAFNERHLSTLDPSLQQVERKLLWGFNETLKAKAFLNPSPPASR
jgi:hypothetical protein